MNARRARRFSPASVAAQRRPGSPALASRGIRRLAPASVAVAALASVAVLPGAAQAQSLVGVRGLGVVGGMTDARTSALGNLGIGLAGTEVSAADPTAGKDLAVPTISLTMQPVWGEFELESESGEVTATRFPLIGFVFPVVAARGAVTAAFSGQLDQRWSGEVPRDVDLGEGGVQVSDRFEADGGISIVRAGWVQRIGANAAAGMSLGAYLGRLNQTFQRSLDTTAVDGSAQRFVQEGAWQYGGAVLSLGASLAPHRLVHLAGAVEWSGTLTASPKEGTDGGPRAYSIPLRVSAGATGRLTPRLAFNASVAFQDWSAAAGFAQGTTTTGKFSYGAGVEATLAQGASRSVPLRAGYRRLAQPFRFEDANAVETAWSLGLGLNLAETQGQRLGWVDVGIERGTRSSAPLVERYWRATVSLGISQF